MIENAADFVIEHADVLGARRRFDAQQLFGGQTEGMLLVHRADVIQPVEIGHRLGIGLVFDQLFGAAMQQADMRVRPLDHFAAHFQDETQHTVGRRMLRAKVDGVSS